MSSSLAVDVVRRGLLAHETSRAIALAWRALLVAEGVLCKKWPVAPCCHPFLSHDIRVASEPTTSQPSFSKVTGLN